MKPIVNQDLCSQCSGSVAIVGNADSLIGKNLGPLIDSFDTVIRINHGFPFDRASQGRKTDLVALSCSVGKIRFWWAYGGAGVIWMTREFDAKCNWMKGGRNLKFYPEECWLALTEKLGGGGVHQRVR